MHQTPQISTRIPWAGAWAGGRTRLATVLFPGGRLGKLVQDF